MATHRDEGAGYPGQAYPTPEYPSTAGAYPPPGGQQLPEHRSAEPIPRYPTDPQGAGPAPRPTTGSPAAESRPQPDESLRLVAGDLPQPPPAQYVPPPQAAQQPPEQPAALSDMLHEPTQYTEALPAYQATGAQPGTGYRGGQHARLAWGLAALAILFEVPVTVVLVRSLTGPAIGVQGVVAGLFLLPGIPLFAAGLYHLFTGQVVVRPGEGLAAAVRKPMALLLVGLVLLVAGAVAAG